MTDQTGAVETPAAGGNEGEGNAAVNTEGAKEVTVPLEVVTKLKDELKSVKGDRDKFSQELNLFKANAQFQPQTQQPPAQKPDETPQKTALFEGLDDDELPNVGELKKVLEGLNQRPQPQSDPMVQNLAATVAKIQMRQIDPAFEQTIKTYLPEMINAKPEYQQLLQAQQNDPFGFMETAHTIAKMNPKYQEAQTAGDKNDDKTPDPMEQLNQILENANKPGSPAQVGGTNAINAADRFAKMTKEEFEAHKARVISGNS
jgi:hypothetical protein